MKPLKIGAMVLLSAIALLGFSLALKILFSGVKSNPASVANQKDDVNKESVEKLKTQTPLKWVESVQEESQPIAGESKKTETEKSALQKLLDEMKSLERVELGLSPTTQKTTETVGETKDFEDYLIIGEYYKNFLEAVIKANFTDEEFKAVKKEPAGERVLLLEELMEELVSGTPVSELKSSLDAWHQLDKRVLTELNKIFVKPEALYLHRPMVDWFNYHSETAEKLSQGNFSQNEIIQLVQQFKEKAEIHNSAFGKSLAGLRKSPDFVSIPKAQALTCGAFVPPLFYHLGGRVTLMQFCNFGIIETISPPCGGLIFFSYPVLVANPFLYKKPTSGSTILGRSVVIPGACPLGVCPYCTWFYYEAIALYFGTSLVP